MARICLVGASGRMGQRLLRLLPDESELTLGSVLTRPGGRPVTVDAPVLENIDAALGHADVVIDFSAPPQCGAVAPRCAARRIPLLVASTGLTPADEAAVRAAADQVAVLVAANLSVGVNVMLELVELATERLQGYDIEIAEIHHRHKRDAPSGTAYALGAAAFRGRDGLRRQVVGRGGSGAPRGSDEIGYAAIRGGEVPGEHTVFFFGENERVEITHRSANADIFAAGALQAARWLLGRPAGSYTMADVLRRA